MRFAVLGSIFGGRSSSRTNFTFRFGRFATGTVQRPVMSPTPRKPWPFILGASLIEPSRYGPRHYMNYWIVGRCVIRNRDALPHERWRVVGMIGLTDSCERSI
jgi:hypothetical protein